MRVVPKGHTPGRYRLITDLSFPQGASMNEGISSELCSLTGGSDGQAPWPGREAGHSVCVPPQPDRSLPPGHGFRYVDASLPFGLRSAPKIFTVVADALQWVVHKWSVK